MPGRASLPPTPTELAAWLGVASPRTARGRYRWSPARADWSESFSWMGARPVMAGIPADVDLAFWHAAPDAWRVEGPDGPICTSDGSTAVVWGEGGPEVGAALLMAVGPDGLLHPSGRRTRPSTGPRGAAVHAGGTVERDDLLDRPCWRWESAERTVWVDEQSGCALRLDEERGRRELTAFEVDVDVDPALFAPPEEAVAPREGTRRRTAEPPPTAGPPGPAEAPPSASFAVPWWPDGTPGHPVDGDAAVPELLVELHRSSERDPRFWIGVAPAGTPARTRRGCRVRRWEGDGWSFALSWTGDVPEDDLERLVASTPRSWT